MDRKHRPLPGQPGIVDLDTKRLRIELKADGSGRFSAVISTFNTIDADNDYTLPGAFAGNDAIAISAWGHQTWGAAPPVGKGRIRETASEAIVDGQFFMNTTAGRDTHELVTQMGELQQWSYGYDPADTEPGTIDGKSVRILKRLKVYEASPVLVGAGVGTRTLNIAPKSALPVDLADIRARLLARDELARNQLILVHHQRATA